MGWVVNSTPRSFYPRESDPVLMVQEAGWAPGPVWTAVKNLAPTGIRSPDRPARSESLYRLRYSGPLRVSKFLRSTNTSPILARSRTLSVDQKPSLFLQSLCRMFIQKKYIQNKREYTQQIFQSNPKKPILILYLPVLACCLVFGQYIDKILLTSEHTHHILNNCIICGTSLRFIAYNTIREHHNLHRLRCAYRKFYTCCPFQTL